MDSNEDAAWEKYWDAPENWEGWGVLEKGDLMNVDGASMDDAMQLVPDSHLEEMDEELSDEAGANLHEAPEKAEASECRSTAQEDESFQSWTTMGTVNLIRSQLLASACPEHIDLLNKLVSERLCASNDMAKCLRYCKECGQGLSKALGNTFRTEVHKHLTEHRRRSGEKMTNHTDIQVFRTCAQFFEALAQKKMALEWVQKNYPQYNSEKWDPLISFLWLIVGCGIITPESLSDLCRQNKSTARNFNIKKVKRMLKGYRSDHTMRVLKPLRDMMLAHMQALKMSRNPGDYFTFYSDIDYGGAMTTGVDLVLEKIAEFFVDNIEHLSQHLFTTHAEP